MDHPKHIIVVSCLVRNADAQVLLIRHPRRAWEIPQGRVEEGEDLLAAAHREVLEETGVEVDLGPLAAVWSKLSPPAALIFGFLAVWRAGDPTPGEESPELGWFSPAEAQLRVSHPVNHDRLRTLLEFDGRLIYGAYTPNPFQLRRKAFFR
jgi:8-oxo-dGTP diphosphatase